MASSGLSKSVAAGLCQLNALNQLRKLSPPPHHTHPTLRLYVRKAPDWE